MQPSQVKRLPPMDRLAYWITERESIRLKKEAGLPKPWTDDPILQQYRFCNVRRMDDRVSRWLLTNWYQPYRDHPNMLAAVSLARHFNTPDTLTWLTNPVFRKGEPDWERIKREVRARKANGNRVFNGAYMVRGIGTADKTEMVVDLVTKPLVEKPPKLDTTTMRRSVESLLPYWGFSSFMAGQVVADLRWAVTGSWLDRNEWAPVGPGSARGLARLLYRSDEWEQVARGYVGKSAKADVEGLWLWEFKKHVLGTLRSLLPSKITDRLEAIDYQNCLCEFDKYERALHGEGTPKQRYPGGSP